MKHLIPLLTTLLCVSFYAQANTSAAGKTILARGAVVATDATSDKQRSLKRRDTVYGVDKITTGEKSKAQFSMSDGGLIALKENSVLNIANYDFDAVTQQGSASIELIKGGLRSISGVIKKNGGSYNVKTPVGSIGIRGTHFELQLVDGDMYVAVWDGAIDLTLKDNSILSLGSNEPFSFAQVTSLGDVIKTTQAPAIFAQSIASININGESDAQQEQITENIASENIEDADILLTDIYAEQQFQAVSNASLIDQIAQRQGIFNYQATSFDVSSSLGEVSDFSMSMAVDFDNGTVPDGEISFNDAGGNWYAAYSGFIDLTKLDLAVTFASHNNNKATGEIDAIFLNDINTITGDFNLNEISNPAINTSGSFRLEP
ncbi:FecR family protein [Pseudoalteromonas sp. MMG007]|uniref:FecR family protein n=1 Tax=Pseudoalteromonas sp. MMG007 TaxID=2822684 RepID=UPI001B38907F|nr:FecR family protein [Pseudoalteromonas sp. MMG007]MBQ4858406.1 FecR domain-containing protein [Pseudoalteromonas sp. MMG007]